MRQLLSQGAAVNALHAGLTALHEAAAGGHVEAAQLLLAHGANVHAPAAGGTLPLELAVAARNEAVVGVLLDAGAAVGGESVKRSCAAALHTAIFNNALSMVRLLLSRGLDPNAQQAATFEKDALWAAVLYSSADVLKVLLQAGAVARETTRLGTSYALQSACAYNYSHKVRLLLQHTDNTPQGLKQLLGPALENECFDVAAQLLLQLQLEQHSVAEDVGEAGDPSALRMAVLKG